MRVEVRLSQEIGEPYAVIHARELTEEVRRAAAALDASAGVVAAQDDRRTVLLRPEEISLIRVEGEKTYLSCEGARYRSPRRLYELEQQLGGGFLRISKSALVNLSHVRSVEPSLSGLLLLCLKNGEKEYISRKYLPEFKRYLGL